MMEDERERKLICPGLFGRSYEKCACSQKVLHGNDGQGRAKAAQVTRYLCAHPVSAPCQVLESGMTVHVCTLQSPGLQPAPAHAVAAPVW